MSAALRLAESVGSLSPSEIAQIPEARFQDAEEKRTSDSARLIYERAYTRAVNALHHREVAELVNSYATCARLLWNAAQLVCDIEELPDDGQAQGIRWGCPL